jgi:hypothetical protein
LTKQNNILLDEGSRSGKGGKSKKGGSMQTISATHKVKLQAKFNIIEIKLILIVGTIEQTYA